MEEGAYCQAGSLRLRPRGSPLGWGWGKVKTRLHHGAASGGRAGAFTLVELLVVLGVLGLLAALVLSACARIKAGAHAVTCATHLRQMGVGLHMYVHDNEDRYPYLVCRGDFLPEFPAAAHWFGKLQPYYSVPWTNRTYHCPGYRGAIWVESGPSAEHDPYGSYAYNGDGVRGYAATVPGSPPCLGLGLAYNPARQTPAVSETEVLVPSQMLALGESRSRRETSLANYHAADCVDGMFCGYLSGRSPDEGGPLPLRHGKHYNQLYCDGHMAAVAPRVLFDPRHTAPMWNSDHELHPELWPPEG
jgi:prepilin-type N-terminal cleavage/methylation domain-containing protein/prepilin-type processing-associated H-X9-DG protein